eukprot:m.262068 g.262068  ORF g.262068 m.262068 type:complete len:52 (+) comp25159_c0_seq1:1-156(+)
MCAVRRLETAGVIPALDSELWHEISMNFPAGEDDDSDIDDVQDHIRRRKLQ